MKKLLFPKKNSVTFQLIVYVTFILVFIVFRNNQSIFYGPVGKAVSLNRHFTNITLNFY